MSDGIIVSLRTRTGRLIERSIDRPASQTSGDAQGSLQSIPPRATPCAGSLPGSDKVQGSGLVATLGGVAISHRSRRSGWGITGLPWYVRFRLAVLRWRSLLRAPRDRYPKADQVGRKERGGTVDRDRTDQAQAEQTGSPSAPQENDANAIAQPPGRAARSPDEGPGLSGGSAAASDAEAAEQEIGGGD